ncbi:regulation of nuclear pre-mRNA domain-containing protein 2-like [Uloborus diversus]|uniref:regulation of nuclear pre-mRNA domain-containing protein 2-like n=1 Tax=Uloborus diversus TaxID=327109 RepID=UPI002408F5D0|nr:regulation of nuclear pre-mRNA domain-containing protein 2-like [Uloborus diversus]
MPRTLNVEKLDKKFASLTRSRESIQGLSSWIMHHKEFYQEIVEEWLNALKKDDFNALNMFYVANDVIQHCGKKKVPEYRTAFSTVLEKALSLAKVKEIKNEVTRMMTLWHDKEIYDDDFFQQLENTLNNEPPTPEISDEEKDLSDAEIVSIFKK